MKGILLWAFSSVRKIMIIAKEWRNNMTKSHNAWKKLLAFAISTILTFVTLPPFIAYADSNNPTPYSAATCGQCDKGTIFSGTTYEEGYQTIPCDHGLKYGFDYRIITYRITYNRCSNCSFYEVTSMESVSATGYYCAGSATPVSISSILNIQNPANVSSCAYLTEGEIPNAVSQLIRDAETYLVQNYSSDVPYAMVCPGCNAAPAVQHYVTDETVVYSPCVHIPNSGFMDAWITPVTMYVTDCGGSCGFRSIHSVEFGTGYMICLA